jgi:feruloyl esterase
MERWVEHGKAPATIIATKASSPLSRPLCPYPLEAKYKGSGDTNDAANFECAAP